MKRVGLTCGHCGAAFEIKRSFADRQHCSPACRAAARGKVERRCLRCGKLQLVWRSRVHDGKQYCGTACATHADQRQNLAKALEILRATGTMTERGCFVGKGRPGAYTRIAVDGEERVAHRMIWEDLHGPIPDGMFVCHHCDNPPCYLDAHLFLGTHADNMRDKVQKGRGVCGEQHYYAKLTAATVVAMRAEYASAGEKRGTLARLSRKYGTGRENVRNVVNYQTWKHVGAGI